MLKHSSHTPWLPSALLHDKQLPSAFPQKGCVCSYIRYARGSALREHSVFGHREDTGQMPDCSLQVGALGLRDTCAVPEHAGHGTQKTPQLSLSDPTPAPPSWARGKQLFIQNRVCWRGLSALLRFPPGQVLLTHRPPRGCPASPVATAHQARESCRPPPAPATPRYC